MATTRGFVQRLSWLASSTVCGWIGPEPDSTETFTVPFSGDDSARRLQYKQALVVLLREAQFAGREVAVDHPDDSATITGASTVACNTTGTPVQLDAMEVTQAVQDLAHSLPLIAGKRTFVRVYVSHYTSPGITVRGEISVRRGASDVPETIPSTNTVVLDPANAGDVSAKRGAVAQSLNFVLPHSSEGPLGIRLSSVTDAVTGATVDVGCERRPTVWFHRSAPLRVRVLGMRYIQDDDDAHVPTSHDFALLMSWLRRAYPASQVIGSTAVVDATASVPFTCGQINAQVAAIRQLDVDSGTDARTKYYGFVHDGGFFMRGCAAGIPSTPSPSTISSGPTGDGSWGWDFDGSYGDWYGGHELGHTYGRRHPGFCGESESDLDNYPFEGGQLANSAGSFAGFDVGDPAQGLPSAALPGTQWHDVMTYCSHQWLSAYTYLGVRRRLVAEDAMAASPGASAAPPAGPPGSGAGGRPDERYPRARAGQLAPVELAADEVLVNVVASVNLTRQEGSLDFVNPLARAAVSGVQQGGPARLRVKAGDGRVLAEHPVEVHLNSELLPTDDRVGLVDAVVRMSTQARAIELEIDDRIVDSRRVGGQVPAAGAMRFADRGEKGVSVSAEVAALPEGGETYAVQVSTDEGRTWQTVAVGLQHPSATLDRRRFQEGQQVQVRVVATNGLTRSVVGTETFTA